MQNEIIVKNMQTLVQSKTAPSKFQLLSQVLETQFDSFTMAIPIL